MSLWSRALLALLASVGVVAGVTIGFASVFVSACSRAAEPAPPSTPSARDAAPRRIVPASATAVDFVCSLVPAECVAGVPEQALDYSLLHGDTPPWRATRRFYAYEAEPVLALEPDLVVVDPYQSRDTTARLAESGVGVWTLPEVRTWPDARAAWLAVGERIGASERAAELVRAYDERVAALARGASARANVRAMCYSNFGSQGWTAGAKTTLDEVMRLAGVRNAVAERGREGHLTIAFEELLQLDPDVVIVSAPLSSPAGAAGDRGGASEALLLAEPTLRSLRAVAERRIVVVPAWLYATGSQEMVRAAEELAAGVERVLAPRAEGPGR
jgi:iron complex transport system substrate-binding protein